MSTSPYKLVVFDFDGTLADSFPWFLATVNQLAGQHGFRPFEEAEVEALRRLDARRILARLEVPMWKVPLIASELRRRMAEDIDQIRLFDGIGPMLARLAESGVSIAVLTSNAQANVRLVLGEAHVGLVSHYLCGASLFGKRVKMRRLLRSVPYSRFEVLYVGDEIRDLEAARQEGLPFGAVAWGYTLADALAAVGPDELFRTPSEIAERLVGPRH